jgi:hypothetical protein
MEFGIGRIDWLSAGVRDHVQDVLLFRMLSLTVGRIGKTRRRMALYLPQEGARRIYDELLELIYWYLQQWGILSWFRVRSEALSTISAIAARTNG